MKSKGKATPRKGVDKGIRINQSNLTHQTANDRFNNTLKITNYNRQISSKNKGFVLHNNSTVIIITNGIFTPLLNNQVIYYKVLIMEASIN